MALIWDINNTMLEKYIKMSERQEVNRILSNLIYEIFYNPTIDKVANSGFYQLKDNSDNYAIADIILNEDVDYIFFNGYIQEIMKSYKDIGELYIYLPQCVHPIINSFTQFYESKNEPLSQIDKDRIDRAKEIIKKRILLNNL